MLSQAIVERVRSDRIHFGGRSKWCFSHIFVFTMGQDKEMNKIQRMQSVVMMTRRRELQVKQTSQQKHKQ